MCKQMKHHLGIIATRTSRGHRLGHYYIGAAREKRTTKTTRASLGRQAGQCADSVTARNVKSAQGHPYRPTAQQSRKVLERQRDTAKTQPLPGCTTNIGMPPAGTLEHETLPANRKTTVPRSGHQNFQDTSGTPPGHWDPDTGSNSTGTPPGHQDVTGRQPGHTPGKCHTANLDDVVTNGHPLLPQIPVATWPVFVCGLLSQTEHEAQIQSIFPQLLPAVAGAFCQPRDLLNGQ